jgi:hypothetical protein
MQTKESLCLPALSETIEQFLNDSPNAVITEDGRPIFDLKDGHFSISDNRVLHLWSKAANTVRRIVGAEPSEGDRLTLKALRFGCSKPTLLEIHPSGYWHCNVSQRLCRLRYKRLLERILQRDFTDWRIETLTADKDLANGFSDVYTRGLLRKGKLAFVVLGINQNEPQSNINGALTAGILWLESQRDRLNATCVVQGLKLFLPRGQTSSASLIVPHLNSESTQWQILEVDERTQLMKPVDRVHCSVQEPPRLRQVAEIGKFFGRSLSTMFDEAPDAEIETVTEPRLALSFAHRGLPLARAELRPREGTFQNEEVIYFRIGAEEHVLSRDKEPIFREFVNQVRNQRRPEGKVNDKYYRESSSSWLRSIVAKNVRMLSEHIDTRFVYTQFPGCGNRSLKYLLTCRNDGRLVLIAVACDEDISLPLQAVQCWHHVNEFRRMKLLQPSKYFSGIQLADLAPLLYVVCPVFRIHRSFGLILKHFGKEVEWKIVAVNERWRNELKVVGKKDRRSSSDEFFSSEAEQSQYNASNRVLPSSRVRCYHISA